MTSTHKNYITTLYTQLPCPHQVYVCDTVLLSPFAPGLAHVCDSQHVKCFLSCLRLQTRYQGPGLWQNMVAARGRSHSFLMEGHTNISNIVMIHSVYSTAFTLALSLYIL